MTLLLNLNCRKIGIYHLTHTISRTSSSNVTGDANQVVVGLSRIAN